MKCLNRHLYLNRGSTPSNLCLLSTIFAGKFRIKMTESDNYFKNSNIYVKKTKGSFYIICCTKTINL